MKIIVDMDDPRYYEVRAIEFIQEAMQAGQALSQKFESGLVDGATRYQANIELYNESINYAIGLLALARIARGYTIDKESK